MPPKKKSPLIALRSRVAKVPEKPGVYRWLDAEGTILYIGKAKDLRSRMRSYVQEKQDKGIGLPTEALAKVGPWKRSLLEHIADSDYTVTSNELEALILETTLIKKHRPKYNVLMKDDKNYVYVRITLNDPFPAVSVVRNMEEDKAKYFGPFLSARDTRHALDLLHDVFHYHACQRSIDMLNRGKGATVKPCIEYQIGRCNGLCTGKLTEEDYRSRIEEVARFFRSDKSHVMKRMKEMMQSAAAERKFERAGKLRDTIRYFESLEQQQIVSGTSEDNTDAFGIALLKGKAQVVLLQERDGKVIGERSFSLSGSAESASAILEQFLPQYYSETLDIPDTILVSESFPEAELIEEWLSEKRAQKLVHIHLPERGKKSKLLLMAEENAEEKVSQQLAKWEAEAGKVEQALTELKESLGLPSPPKRIECYDISHLGGTETVGSMVVFLDGKAKNDHYRSFTIRTMKKGEIDDYKALKEVLLRRLRHLRSLEEEWKERGVILGKAKKVDVHAMEEILIRNEQTFKGPLTARGCVIARSGEDIVGFGKIVSEKGNIHLIQSIWVDDRFRGNKLGHAILRKLLAQVKKGKVYITIHPHLEEYYAQANFQYVHVVPPIIQEKIELARKGDPHFPPEGRIVMMCEISKNKPDPSLTSPPDLLVLDGGKGQLSTGLDVLKTMNLSIPMISLAKQEEEVFVPGNPSPLEFAKDSEGRFLLMRARDEAHRFANRHREKRLKNAVIPK